MDRTWPRSSRFRRELGNGGAKMFGPEIEQYAPGFGGDSTHRPTVALDAVGAARSSLIGSDVGDTHDETRLVVGDVELVAHHLPECRAGALAAVRLADEERSGVVGMDHDPGVELPEIGVRIRTCADGLREHAAAGDGSDADAKTNAPDD